MVGLALDTPISEVGEHRLIREISARLPQSAAVLIGPGDDAALISAPDRRVAVSTDVVVEGRHFRLDWSSAHDIGRRVAGANLSDVAAMGAVPTALVVGLVLPPSVTLGWVYGLADGLAHECGIVGAAVAGGDLSSGDSIAVSATVLGDLQGRDPVLRSGAHVGDVIAVSGRLGWAAGGLTVLRRGFKSPRVLVEAHRFPVPPYGDGPAAALAGATSMIDVSDGLVLDLSHVAVASGVVMALDTARLPIDDPVRDAAGAFNADPLEWVLGGGDDHALAATFPADAQLPPGFVVIGQVAPGRPEEEADDSVGVTIDGQLWTGAPGFEHFRQP